MNITLSFAVFGGLCSSASGDIMYLICHVTSQDNVIKEYDFSELHIVYVTNLTDLVVMGIALVEKCF